MTDEQISGLFAEGTAPESDPVFAVEVAAGISRARLGDRLRALGLRAVVVLVLSSAIYMAAGVIRPVLAQLVQGAPQFMGVPAPVVLGVLAAALVGALGVRVSLFDAGVRLLEPID
jgi:hypothetical protein